MVGECHAETVRGGEGLALRLVEEREREREQEHEVLAVRHSGRRPLAGRGGRPVVVSD